jgi:metallo-beta-lactamase family protein
MFRDAGHILGSASVTVSVDQPGEQVMIGFTGDIGRPNRPILRDPIQMPQVHYLITESTYGDRKHDALPDASERFLAVLQRTCVEQKGKLIIPAFSLGRTQELVYMMDQMENSGKLPKGIPIYVDSPLAVNATDIFRVHSDCFDEHIREYMLRDQNPFGFNSLHYIRKVEDSKRLNDQGGPMVIISASGMANAGRVRHHIYNSIEDARNTILIVGYCTPHTLGGHLRMKPEAVKIFGQEKRVKASIEVMDSFSAHGDYEEMLAFLDNQDRHKLRSTFLVHGDEPAAESFKVKLGEAGFSQVEIPVLGQVLYMRIPSTA